MSTSLSGTPESTSAKAAVQMLRLAQSTLPRQRVEPAFTIGCLHNTAWHSTPTGVLPALPTADSSLDFSSLGIFTRPQTQTSR